MMAPTHRSFGAAWWLTFCLIANLLGSGIHPLTVIAGTLVASVFAASRWSPDVDTTLLRFLGHRQITHRPLTAAIITVITAGLSVALLLLGRSLWGYALAAPIVTIAAVRVSRARLLSPGLATLAAVGLWPLLIAAGPEQLAWLVWAPVTGWWSHLAGDFVFGRIPVGERTGRILSRILPARLIRRGGGRQPWWVGVGLDTDGLLERGNRRLKTRTASGLHQTRRVLPFAPTTLALRAVTAALMVAVLAQSASNMPS